MNDDEPIDLSGMHLDEIEELLLEMGVELAPETLQEMAQFIQEAGSIDAALEALAEMERKAA